MSAGEGDGGLCGAEECGLRSRKHRRAAWPDCPARQSAEMRQPKPEENVASIESHANAEGKGLQHSEERGRRGHQGQH